jgi:hypothetical protein
MTHVEKIYRKSTCIYKTSCELGSTGVFSMRSNHTVFCNPTAVYSKRVDENATYDDVLSWWHSEDGVARAGRAAVEEGAVCFVQLGGTKEVFVSLPPGQCAVRPCRKVRGKPGLAVLMTYA